MPHVQPMVDPDRGAACMYRLHAALDDLCITFTSAGEGKVRFGILGRTLAEMRARVRS